MGIRPADSNALSVHNGGTVLIVVLLGDPHAGEGGQGSEGRASSPDGESSVWAGNDLHGNGFGCSGLNFLEQSFSNAFEEGGTS